MSYASREGNRAFLVGVRFKSFGTRARRSGDVTGECMVREPCIPDPDEENDS